jgi:photosystem II stability/assembly factor-like uncharacterized protein
VIYDGSIHTSADGGVTWTMRYPSGSWYARWMSIASSADGARLATLHHSGYVWTSSNYGADWVRRDAAGFRLWYGIASSDDGAKLTAVVDGGNIWTSEDHGESWTERANSKNWRGVASSGDGSRLAAYAEDGTVSVSDDSGASWADSIVTGASGRNGRLFVRRH